MSKAAHLMVARKQRERTIGQLEAKCALHEPSDLLPPTWPQEHHHQGTKPSTHELLGAFNIQPMGGSMSDMLPDKLQDIPVCPGDLGAFLTHCKHRYTHTHTHTTEDP
jgi:hypothetical protein